MLLGNHSCGSALVFNDAFCSCWKLLTLTAVTMTQTDFYLRQKKSESGCCTWPHDPALPVRWGEQKLLHLTNKDKKMVAEFVHMRASHCSVGRQGPVLPGPSVSPTRLNFSSMTSTVLVSTLAFFFFRRGRLPVCYSPEPPSNKKSC